MKVGSEGGSKIVGINEAQGEGRDLNDGAIE